MKIYNGNVVGVWSGRTRDGRDMTRLYINYDMTGLDGMASDCLWAPAGDYHPGDTVSFVLIRTKDGALRPQLIEK